MKGKNTILFLAFLAFCGSIVSCKRGIKYGNGNPYRVGIIIFGKLSARHLEVVKEACYRLGNDTITGVAVTELPKWSANKTFYFKPRDRYRAEKMLDSAMAVYKQLRDKYEYLLVVTDQPVSTTVHGKEDYGICGLSRLGSNVSVVSSFHQSDIMFAQTIRHEWGHAVPGIVHCKHLTCIMNDANGKAANLEGHDRFEGECANRVKAVYDCYFHNKCQ